MADKPVAATLRDVDRAAKSEADDANSKGTALRTPGHETHPRQVTRADPLPQLAPIEHGSQICASREGKGKTLTIGDDASAAVGLGKAAGLHSRSAGPLTYEDGLTIVGPIARVPQLEGSNPPPLPKLQMSVSLLWKLFSFFTYEIPFLEALTPAAL
jgi:hypothetical protein